MNLPPGFRFYPTDEELVVHFLQRKAALLPCHPDVIPDLELYPYNPWELEGTSIDKYLPHDGYLKSLRKIIHVLSDTHL